MPELDTEKQISLETLVAQQALQIAELQEKLSQRCKGDDIPFVPFLYEWLEMQTHLQDDTKETYTKQLDNHIAGYFNKLGKNLSQVTDEDIEEYYQYKIKGGYNTNTIIRHHATIFSAFKYAKKQELILKNPMDKVKRPQETQYHSAYLTASEICTLLNEAANHYLFVPIFIAVMLGLRRSEILGLQWESINFSLGTVTICKKVMRVNKKDILKSKLKTKSSYRTLILPENLLRFLKRIRVKQLLVKNHVPRELHPNFKYVCVDLVRNKGHLLTLSQVSNGFYRLVRRIEGIRVVRFQDLRVSCATFLLHMGCSLRHIQAWLGHSNYTTTAKYYAHVDIVDKRRTAEFMNRVFEQVEAPTWLAA